MVDSFVGGVLLEVDNHLMGGPGHAHHNNMERLRGNIELGKVLLWLEAEDVIRTPYLSVQGAPDFQVWMPRATAGA